jgi:uncharacterized membrane protein HdeD (DUF308 family)
MSAMKWAMLIAGLLLIAAGAAFWLLETRTAAMIVFALIAAAFFGSLPWVIGGVMDRKKQDRTGGVVVRGFGDDAERDGE